MQTKITVQQEEQHSNLGIFVDGLLRVIEHCHLSQDSQIDLDVQTRIVKNVLITGALVAEKMDVFFYSGFDQFAYTFFGPDTVKTNAFVCTCVLILNIVYTCFSVELQYETVICENASCHNVAIQVLHLPVLGICLPQNEVTWSRNELNCGRRRQGRVIMYPTFIWARGR